LIYNAFDRLLCRLFAKPNAPWLLKGGYALELRLKTARTTRDMDLAVVFICARESRSRCGRVWGAVARPSGFAQTISTKCRAERARSVHVLCPWTKRSY